MIETCVWETQFLGSTTAPVSLLSESQMTGTHPLNSGQLGNESRVGHVTQFWPVGSKEKSAKASLPG